METLNKSTTIKTTIWAIIWLVLFGMWVSTYISKFEARILVLEQKLLNKADKIDVKIIETKLINIESLLVDIKSKLN